MRQICRANPAPTARWPSNSSLPLPCRCCTDFAHEFLHFLSVFLSGPGFDAAADVHGVGLCGANRFADVFGRQATGEENARLRVATPRDGPIKRLACAAAQLRVESIEEDGGGSLVLRKF